MSELKCELAPDAIKRLQRDVNHRYSPLIDYIDGVRHHILYIDQETKTGLYSMTHIFAQDDEYEDEEIDNEKLQALYEWMYECNHIYDK